MSDICVHFDKPLPLERFPSIPVPSQKIKSSFEVLVAIIVLLNYETFELSWGYFILNNGFLYDILFYLETLILCVMDYSCVVRH